MQKKLLHHYALWEEWKTNTSDVKLQEVLAYQNSRGEKFELLVNEVLYHLFNHGSNHNDQLVRMLRQLGIDKISSTDFIE